MNLLYILTNRGFPTQMFHNLTKQINMQTSEVQFWQTGDSKEDTTENEGNVKQHIAATSMSL